MKKNILISIVLLSLATYYFLSGLDIGTYVSCTSSHEAEKRGVLFGRYKISDSSKVGCIFRDHTLKEIWIEKLRVRKSWGRSEVVPDVCRIIVSTEEKKNTKLSSFNNWNSRWKVVQIDNEKCSLSMTYDGYVILIGTWIKIEKNDPIVNFEVTDCETKKIIGRLEFARL